MRLIFQRDVDGASGDVYFMRLAGLSTETKPTENVATGSIFIEVDTDKKYRYDEDSTTWTEEPAAIDPEAISEAVEDWLDDHPEATTTVVDGAITYAKLDSSLKGSVDDVSDLKNALDFGSVSTQTDVTSDLVSGKKFDISANVGGTVSPTMNDNQNYKCASWEVNSGDQFVITGKLGYAFTNQSYVIISKVGDTADFSQDTITATVDGYLFLNSNKNIARTIIRKTSTPITLQDKLDEKLDVDQGVANAGKIMKVGLDGVLTAEDNIQIDNTLQESGEAADAEAVGIAVNSAKADANLKISRLDENFVKIQNMFNDPTYKDITDTNNFVFERQASETVTNGVLTCVSEAKTGQNIELNCADSLSTDVIYYNIKLSITGMSGNYLSFNCFNDNRTINTDGTHQFSNYNHGGASKKLVLQINGSSVRTISIYCPIAINVTALFGAGHEPTITEFERLLSNYNRDLFGEWISLQKYDTLLGNGNIYAENIAYKTLIDPYNNYITIYSETATDVTGDGSKTYIKSPDISYQGKYQEGDILFTSMWLKIGDSSCDKIAIYQNNKPSDSLLISEVDNPDADTWYRLSGIKVGGSTSSTSRYACGAAIYADATTQNGKTLSYKLGMALNLTTIFGKGNEPMDAAVIDKMLEKFTDQWFCGTRDIWNPAVIPMIMPGYAKEHSNGAVLGVAEEGRLYAKSVINRNLSDWAKGQFNYGLSSWVVPINHKFEGGIQTDGMISVFPKYGRWEKGAADKTGEGGSIFGGHVFEAWNNAGTYRLTMMMAHGGDEREDEACIITYCPGVFNSPLVPFTEEQEENRITPDPADYYGDSSTYMQGRIRIGSDKAGEGTVFRSKSMKCYGSAIFNGSYGTVNHNNSSGEKGTLKYDENYLYICVADNTWRRVALDNTW